MAQLIGDFLGRTVSTSAGAEDVFHLSLEGPSAASSEKFPRLACLEVPEQMGPDERSALAQQLVLMADAIDRQFVDDALA